ncbi:H+/Cl- antiporter ClcA [Kitasatospora sp. MAA4]|uniref:ion channel protein n=1 Tax=Kitasatospora sp. MAA4 TaxID=3035093 RepID=UPI002476F7BB|nr:ion channel protein [Kitasatospora sp. MAA4]MDH6133042.1 H+/Cl- antiporter ClcA [Kitasatospora sp. MAA4]
MAVAAHPATDVNRPPQTPAARLIPLIVPAILVGVVAALVLLGLSKLAGQLERLVWQSAPAHFGFAQYDPWWVITVLTATGLLIGLAVWLLPGHAGPDPATTGLVDPPQPPYVLPGLAVVTVLALAGGVSLGPENPITMINIALACWIGRLVVPRSPNALWVGLAAAGTIGALFGTPLAAALILSEMPGPGVLWDRLFAPLVAAASGALTTLLIDGNDFVINMPPYPGARAVDLFWAMLVSSAGALLGLAAVYALPFVHQAFHQLRNPVVMLVAGGLTLGVIGVIGGHLTLFKGLDQMKELASTSADYGAWGLLGMALVKMLAVLVASCAGFRGGRIFPAVFAGAALGFSASTFVTDIPSSLAVACAILGVLFAVTRQGWLSLFTAAVIVPDYKLVPLLCVAALPAWLIVTGRPQMIVTPAATD